MARPRFQIELGDELEREMARMALDQGISQAEAVKRALVGYANLRRLTGPGKEIVLRKIGLPDTERTVHVL